MCGFAGIVAWQDQHRIDRALLAQLSQRIAHRGPDGQGCFVNHQQAATPQSPQCGLVFRRLAVLDPDPRANQPFSIGPKTLVFNGEIYNFRDLRRELETLRPDYAWRTTGDTEVLLLAYDTWGPACLERLNGMFALALWDQQEKTLFLARDRMGQKPLYLAMIEGGVVAFASEIPPLRLLPWVRQEMDLSALGQYLEWGYVPENRTFYPAIEQLPPGRGRILRAGRVERDIGYFDLKAISAEARPLDDAQAVERTRQLLCQAVRRRLVADVPLGCFLSGGIDSSIIAAAMKAVVPAGQPVLTFSIGFDDPRYDERAYARQVASHLGTEHREFVVRPDAAADLPRIAAVFGQPFADSSALPTYYLARETRRHVTVALSGDGGDEMFGGYDRYRAMALAQTLQQTLPRPASRLLTALAPHLPGWHPKSPLARAKRFLAALNAPPGQRYAAYLRLLERKSIQALLRPEVWEHFQQRDFVAEQFDAAPGASVVQKALAVDRISYLPDDLLAKVDRCSMLHALEVRSPFMDPDLVRLAVGLSQPQLLLGGPKRMLRAAFAPDLPSTVFTRRKMGFAVPIGHWFRGQLRPMLHDLLFATNSFAKAYFNLPAVQQLIDEHEQFRLDHSQRLYALLMLELWWQTQRSTPT